MSGEFYRFCADVAALLRIDERFVPRIASFLTAARRLPLIWFQFTDCGACKDSFVKGPYRWQGDLLLAHIPESAQGSAPRSSRAVQDLATALRSSSGKYLCVVEGAPPPRHASPSLERMLDVAAEVCSNARAVLCVGSCTATTVLAAAAAGPVLTDALGLPAMHVPGCPPTPVAFAAALLTHLLGGAAALAPPAPWRERPELTLLHS